jgi:C-5 cytosine-specific DNA methylase
MRILDLFCGRWGWSKAFAARGWECVGVDLVKPALIPDGCQFMQADVLDLHANTLCVYMADVICASPPCEEFSVWGMKHFHSNPKYPDNGMKLFNHTRNICEQRGVPHIIENVRAAQQFVGNAVHHCGPFYLWGNAVPPILNQGIKKGNTFRGAPGNYMDTCPPGFDKKTWRNAWQKDVEQRAGGRRYTAAFAATIPPELANCVADYVERLLEQRKQTPTNSYEISTATRHDL